MGRAQKLKVERKKERVAAEIRRKKRINTSFKLSILFLILVVVGVGGYYGYNYLDSKYDLDSKVTNIFSKDKESEEEVTERKTYDSAPEMQIDLEKTYTAKFETNKGDFEAILYTKDAPKTVNNFVVLSRDGFYNNLTFHRVISDFMVQGGDPEGTGSGGPGYQFEDEINDHKLVRGTLAMANSGEDTNGSQFFVVTAEATDWLDGKHTAFGEITEGLDAVMDIEKVKTDESDKPLEPVVIQKITIEEK
ncbi:MAG: peptidylprolyl isomerase [Patescibacteria group bacterium]|nr:peptidylprolyl isomerase [Patescibacteria group bacterium]